MPKPPTTSALSQDQAWRVELHSSAPRCLYNRLYNLAYNLAWARDDGPAYVYPNTRAWELDGSAPWSWLEWRPRSNNYTGHSTRIVSVEYLAPACAEFPVP